MSERARCAEDDRRRPQTTWKSDRNLSTVRRGWREVTSNWKKMSGAGENGVKQNDD